MGTSKDLAGVFGFPAGHVDDRAEQRLPLCNSLFGDAKVHQARILLQRSSDKETGRPPESESKMISGERDRFVAEKVSLFLSRSPTIFCPTECKASSLTRTTDRQTILIVGLTHTQRVPCATTATPLQTWCWSSSGLRPLPLARPG